MSDPVQVCGLRVGERLFGVPINAVREINRELVWTPVAHTSNTVAGLINIRGQIQVVLDLGVVLGLEQENAEETSDDQPKRKRRLVILKDTVAPGYGLLVDQVADIIDMDPEKVERRSTGDLNDHQLVAGAYQMPEELLILLDVAAVASLDLLAAGSL